jgi:hypothetical protein
VKELYFMKLSSIKNAVTSKVARQVLVGKKNSPTIMFGAGVVGVVATTVLASRATLKLDDILTEHEDNINKSRELEKHHPDYSSRDARRDRAYIHAKTSVAIGKAYGPAIVVGVVSIGLLTSAHVTLNRRNAGLTAAYAALDKGFKEYRARVIDEYGEEKDREFRHGSREITEKVVDDNGKTKERSRKVADGVSIYARFFDQYSSSWNKTPEYNLLFLRCQQNYLNDRLKAKGHVFLNEAYDALGLDRSKEGAVVGWLRNGDGDGYVDFGIFDGQHMDRFHDFVTGSEGSILLDFNVDGVIYDKI